MYILGIGVFIPACYFFEGKQKSFLGTDCILTCRITHFLKIFYEKYPLFFLLVLF